MIVQAGWRLAPGVGWGYPGGPGGGLLTTCALFLFMGSTIAPGARGDSEVSLGF